MASIAARKSSRAATRPTRNKQSRQAAPLAAPAADNSLNSPRPITIAVDAMGGDHGPGVTVPAALAALEAESDLHVVLVGLAEPVTRLLNEAPAGLRKRISVHEATQVVAMDEKPQDALRRKKDSSMRVAIDLVKAGDA